MEKIMLISAGSIHTFDKIKDDARYKFKFLCRYRSERSVIFEYDNIRLEFEENPKEHYRKRRTVNPIEIEEILIDLCIAGIDISDYFISKQQNRYKIGYSGERCYKAIFKDIRVRAAKNRNKIKSASRLFK